MVIVTGSVTKASYKIGSTEVVKPDAKLFVGSEL